MNRRQLLALAGAGTFPPTRSFAQSVTSLKHVGYQSVGSGTTPGIEAEVAAFEAGLKQLGWVVSQNIAIVYRFSGASPEQMRADARELVALTPDVLVSNATLPIQAMQAATHTIPIVFTGITDPVGSGIVASLANPGGNTTGNEGTEFSEIGKWVDLLQQIMPSMKRVAVLYNQANAAVVFANFIDLARGVTSSLGLGLVLAAVEGPPTIDAAFGSLSDGETGVVAIPDGVMSGPPNLGATIAAAAAHRVPTVYGLTSFVPQGGLMAYGADRAALAGQASTYVDKILRGTSPANLPVQAPTKFDLAINLKAARALGLTVPDALLALADTVIE